MYVTSTDGMFPDALGYFACFERGLLEVQKGRTATVVTFDHDMILLPSALASMKNDAERSVLDLTKTLFF